MKKKIYGKIMVMSIIIAGLLQICQDLVIGYSTILNNIKIGILVVALTTAVIALPINFWFPNRKTKSKHN